MLLQMPLVILLHFIMYTILFTHPKNFFTDPHR